MLGIDIFAGAGGMSLGAQWAGIRLLFAVESHPIVATTYSRNHPDVPTLNCRVEDIREIRVPKSTEPLVLFGGPPCQGFSTSNQKTRSEANSSNWLFTEFMRISKLLRPDWVVLENVKGILETSKGGFLRRIRDGFHDLGYCTDVWVLNAADFGIPQSRTRVFILGTPSRKLPADPPTPNTIVPTVRDAIWDLPVLRNGSSKCARPYRCDAVAEYAKALREGRTESCNHLVSRNAEHVIRRYARIPPGGNWSDIPRTMMANYENVERCHTGIYRRLEWNAPSVVIGNFRKNMLVHPSQNRGLSVREAARLQSFPDKFTFLGSIGFQQQQVGNAVPPLLAKAVFRRILDLHNGRFLGHKHQ